MYPAPFRYHRPENLQQAIGLLARCGEDARLMAGGQSLIPMMKLRMGDVSDIIDIGRLPDLSFIEQRGDTLHIGGLATHAQIGRSDVAATIPAVTDAANGIADRQVRSMGTIAGGLCVADPSGCWPTVLRLLKASAVIAGGGGTRTVPVADFLLGEYDTCLNPDDIVTEIQVPVPGADTTSAYVAFKGAASAFPTCSVGIQLAVDGQTCTGASLVLGCAGPTVVVSTAAEALLEGEKVNEQSLRAAAEIIVAAASPPPDARGSEAFKRAMLTTLVVEAGKRALARAAGETVKGGHIYA